MKRTKNKSHFKKIFLSKIASLLNENIGVRTSENLFNLMVRMKKGGSSSEEEDAATAKGVSGFKDLDRMHRRILSKPRKTIAAYEEDVKKVA